MKPISPRQGEVLDFIVEFTKTKGMSPTLREIGKALGIGSTNGVACHLQYLMNKGYLKPRPKGETGEGPATRSLQLTDKAKREYGMMSAEDRLAELRTMFEAELFLIPNQAAADKISRLLYPDKEQS